MAIVKYAGEEAVRAIAGYVNKKLTLASSMPDSPEDGQIVLFVGASDSSYVQGGVYQYDKTNTKWIVICAINGVELTMEEYSSLPKAVQENGIVYYIKDAGTGAEGAVTYGYYNSTDGKFYKENTYTTEIMGSEDVLYVTKDTSIFYKYISNGETFIAISGSAATKGFTDNVEPGNHNLVESNAVYAAISRSIASVYVPHGDLTCAELVSSLLIAANVGNLYNMTDSGTSTADFIGGAGQAINVGDTVGIVQTGPDVYKFNIMPGLLDLHDYYSIEDAATTDIADGDYFPMYDTSASSKKKTLWSTIVEKLKTVLQPRTLDSAISVAGSSKTTVESGLSSIAELIPNNATTSNKLITLKTFANGGKYGSQYDCNTLEPGGCLVNEETLNTPYQQGLTTEKIFQINTFRTIDTSDGYTTQIAVGYSTRTIYQRLKADSGWTPWSYCVKDDVDNGSLIDVSSCVNTSNFTVGEYFRVKKIGPHTYVLDIGGLAPKAGAAGLRVTDNFPYTMKNRFVVPVTNDSAPYSCGLMFNSLNGKQISIHCAGLTGKGLYGQAIFFT